MISTVLTRDGHICSAQCRYRKAYQIFGQPKGGISFEQLWVKLQQLGIQTTQDDAMRLFRRMDDNDSGVVSFPELVASVIPNDYGVNRWAAQRATAAENQYFVERCMRKLPKETVLQRRHTRARMPSKLDTTIKDVGYYMHLLSEAILRRVKFATRTQWEAYCLLVGGKRDGKFSLADFEHRCKQLGIELPHSIAVEIFSKFDSDGSGSIDVHEAVKAILPDERDCVVLLRHDIGQQRIDRIEKYRRKIKGPIISAEGKVIGNADGADDHLSARSYHTEREARPATAESAEPPVVPSVRRYTARPTPRDGGGRPLSAAPRGRRAEQHTSTPAADETADDTHDAALYTARLVAGRQQRHGTARHTTPPTARREPTPRTTLATGRSTARPQSAATTRALARRRVANAQLRAARVLEAQLSDETAGRGGFGPRHTVRGGLVMTLPPAAYDRHMHEMDRRSVPHGRQPKEHCGGAWR